MGRRIFARVIAGLLIMSSALWTVNAFAQVERPWVWIQAKPSIPKDMLCQPEDYEVFAFRVGCYDVSKGRWKDCETLFMEYYSLSGVPAEERLLWTGGHEHSRSTGDVYRTLGFLASAVDESGGSDPTLFYGHTLNQGWNAYKGMPEASGVVRVMGRYTCGDTRFRFLPDDVWRLDPADPSGRTVYAEIAFLVGVFGLEVLPDSEDYLKDSNHPGHSDPVFCGTSDMNRKLAKLAREFRENYPQGGTVSFNDLSLQYGGLYDVDQDWDCDHVLHREGKSADVNRTVPKEQLKDLAKRLGLTECHPGSSRMHFEMGPCKKRRS